MPRSPDHRSLLYIEFCGSNSSFPGLGNIRPSKRTAQAAELLPPPPHPLRFASSFAEKRSLLSLQGLHVEASSEAPLLKWSETPALPLPG